ncbi:hypothetical protein K491DRAFT_696656 [Lophiostoma macrostomum CBS 122681]|uniref:X-Pro dipeptidyl-peptidase n=1 Tax=Lophiostoma macrostomum CBS 122681 TaxID=1314788 RepID=A0A6A6SUD1_9PLEO|nr:hypothetical protein K491DRAFT_696656 [Lophiostoma macrostomum CBS 122681]
MRDPVLPAPDYKWSSARAQPWTRRPNLQPCTNEETMGERIERVRWDLVNITDFHKVRCSPQRYSRLQEFLESELQALDKVQFDKYDQESKTDYILLRNFLRLKSRQLVQDAEKDQKVVPYLGVHLVIQLVRVIEARQRVDDMDGKRTAEMLVKVLEHIAMTKRQIVDGNEPEEATTALRATKILRELQSHLQEWYAFYKDYDPLFTWWVSEPYLKLDKALGDLSDTIKRAALGIEPDDEDTIIGEPVGRTGLLDALESEMIPYTPEELIEIGKKEYAWCEKEMHKAATKLGLESWRAALEKVKNDYVEPGLQPILVRDLTREAAEYVKKHDLVTVPKVCEETITTFMMSPARQKVNPFFLGGDEIIVSYPTSSMPHQDKLMSMRGNNKHFARATVFHEMIPGHHLQMHYMKRVRPYRQMFFTPFCIEGWAFYWEVLLYASDSWKKTPENRIGMLFWRMHRCARIVFSLKYHLGEMTAQECVDLLVDWVGHERATAEGEVRRSIMEAEYGPLYQAGYMLGGLQIWALRKEGVERMGEKKFHDLFLRANQMPVELFRALIEDEKIGKDFESSWRFYEELEDRSGAED